MLRLLWKWLLAHISKENRCPVKSLHEERGQDGEHDGCCRHDQSGSIIGAFSVFATEQ